MHTVPALGTGVRPRPLLQTVHLSVLGGRTLNVAVPFPRRPEGLAAARLELIRGGRRLSLDLVQEPRRDGSLLLTATTALLHAGPTERDSRGLVLDSGVWRLVVVTTDDGGRETRSDLTAPTPSTMDGPTLPTSPSTSSGAVFRPVRSVDGRAMLKVTGPAQQAELVSFDLRWDRITVHGRLLAARHPVGEYTVEAVRRGTTKAVPAHPVWDGDTFTFDLPLAAMTAGSRTQRTWDVQLRAGRTRLKLARRLTHVRHPKQIFRTPYSIIALESGSLTRVHAHLTPSGALAVACAAFGTNEDA
ncbi:hypothetical protein ABZ901_32410 [Actinacidiphila alni]|uniref:hypothetical protein n=1 Tax=Actinacidiphila alni TaxID=380248 RepID=UPI0033FA038B